MAQNSRCRVCLAADVRMHWIQNTQHKEIFEKLASTELNAEDGRLHTICYICYSQLQRCCRFSEMCHKSEQFLRDHLLYGTEAVGAVPPTEINHNLTVSALQFMSLIDCDYSNQENTEVQVKHELLITEEISFKEEPIDIEESALVEDATVDDNLIGLEQPPVTVNTETKNVCALPYYCDVCGITFSMKYKLSRHMQIHFSKKPVHACTRCNKTFNKISHLKSHMRIHTGEKPYACILCNKTFTETSTMRKHMKIHTGEKPHACNICDKTFILNSDLQKHLRIHTGEKPYACNKCNKTFTEGSNLRRHMRIHTGEKPYECNICNKTYTESGNLKKHMRIHTGEKPFACNMCNKTFTEKGSLRRHVSLQHVRLQHVQ